MKRQSIIVRYGEISLKGNNRPEFERALEQNMKRALSGFEEQVEFVKSGGRLVVEADAEVVSPVVDKLRNVFGILSLSIAKSSALDMQAIAEQVVQQISDRRTMPGAPIQTFKMEVRRANKRYPMTSPQVAQELGGCVLDAIPGIEVDVHTPDITVFVEIRDHEALVYADKIPAVGGMPVGTAGKVGLLLSGGIDSPVAGWLTQKRGAELEAIHFHSFPFTSERALQKVETLAQILADWGGRVRMHTVHFTEVQTEIRKHCPEELGITIMRRMMMRIATKIATERKLLALATGESLGQVASQTLESMNVINAVTNIPILRPLIAEDKVDIIRRSREIGTYETSILPYEDCCTIFVPKSPRTRPKQWQAEQAEAKLDIERLVDEAVERTEQKIFTGRKSE